MNRSPRMLAGMLLLALAFLIQGCGDNGSPSPTPDPVPQNPVSPDFTLSDLNVNSPTYNNDVSPREYLTKISAWYFGAAT